MRNNFKEYNQNEQYLFPPSLHDWLPEGHLAYFISEIVEENGSVRNIQRI